MSRLAAQDETAVLRSPSCCGELQLVGGHFAASADEAVRADIHSAQGRISKISRREEGEREFTSTNGSVVSVDLSGYLILPGLVNAHDHLEFNLFPRLGHGPYPSAAKWAEVIHRLEGPTIRQQSAAPKPARLWWGGIKNLLCGATTVCHHNPFEEEVFGADFPVRVVRDFGWTHSLVFGKQINAAYEATPDGAPFILHLAEGTDTRSQEEIFTLDGLGVLDSRTVIVHGVGLNRSGLELLKQRGAGLVWCPTSNHFTLGRTLNYQDVRGVQRIALGSDSALTGQGDLLDEINFVSKESGLKPSRMYSMVTEGGAEVLRLQNGEGKLREGAVADFVIVKWRGNSPAETLALATFKDIDAVVLGGQLNSVSPHLEGRWARPMLDGLEPLIVEGTERWVRAPVADLIAATTPYLGNSIRLAGKQIGL